MSLVGVSPRTLLHSHFKKRTMFGTQPWTRARGNAAACSSVVRGTRSTFILCGRRHALMSAALPCYDTASLPRWPSKLQHARCCAQAPQGRAEPARYTRRRSVLSALVSIPLSWRAARAAEGDVRFLEPGSSVIGRFVEETDGWQKFETLDFQLEVPPGFNYVEAPKQAVPQGRGRAAPPSAIKAIFVDSEDRSVTVVEYSASQIKPTFFQVGDISQFGSVTDVARLLTPPGTQLLSTLKTVVEQPERDTGTIRGTVKAAPQTIYRFEYQLRSGMHITTAAVARAGKVLLAGGVAPSSQWDAQPAILRRAVESFQLSFPN